VPKHPFSTSRLCLHFLSLSFRSNRMNTPRAVEVASSTTLAEQAELKARLGGEGKAPEVPAGLALSRVEDSPYFVLSFSKTPEHPADPLTWSVRRRSFITLLAALLVMLVRLFLSGLASTLI
jgi:hypothetical protein